MRRYVKVETGRAPQALLETFIDKYVKLKWEAPDYSVDSKARRDRIARRYRGRRRPASA